MLFERIGACFDDERTKEKGKKRRMSPVRLTQPSWSKIRQGMMGSRYDGVTYATLVRWCIGNRQNVRRNDFWEELNMFPRISLSISTFSDRAIGVHSLIILPIMRNSLIAQRHDLIRRWSINSSTHLLTVIQKQNPHSRSIACLSPTPKCCSDLCQ